MIPRLPTGWRIIHWLIILNFLAQVIYGSAMVFFVVTPGTAGPLMGGAADVPHELMMVRRAYALETWVAITGLCIYLAITEIAPRRR